MKKLLFFMFLCLISSFAYAEGKSYKWTAVYGPFSEEIVNLNAKAKGWRQHCYLENGTQTCKVNSDGVPVDSKDKTDVQYLTDALVNEQAQVLGTIKARMVSEQYYAQAQNASKAVIDETRSLITATVEEQE